jgi:hypothetical protein
MVKKNSSPSVALGEEVFPKKKRTAPTVSNLPRVLGRHSGKASPSVRFLALGEDLFLVRGVPGGSSPSVALREGLPECFCPFPECQHLALGEANISREKNDFLFGTGSK